MIKEQKIGINLVKERLEAQKRNGIKKVTSEKIVKETSQKEVKKIVEHKQLEFCF